MADRHLQVVMWFDAIKFDGLFTSAHQNDLKQFGVIVELVNASGQSRTDPVEEGNKKFTVKPTVLFSCLFDSKFPAY